MSEKTIPNPAVWDLTPDLLDRFRLAEEEAAATLGPPASGPWMPKLEDGDLIALLALAGKSRLDTSRAEAVFRSLAAAMPMLKALWRCFSCSGVRVSYQAQANSPPVLETMLSRDRDEKRVQQCRL